MNEKIKENIFALSSQFDTIPAERKAILEKLASNIRQMITSNQEVNLLYVCTHNSRRSHFGQVAGSLAAAYYGFGNIQCFSAGTEVKAMNANAVNALVDFGFWLSVNDVTDNPVYTFEMDAVPSIECFSKRFDDESIPKDNVIAIMTCTHAEQNCPFIPSVKYRIATPYEDPKRSDGSGNERAVYYNRFAQIMTEVLYTFSLLK